MATNPVMHLKSRHFELDLHFVCEHVQQKCFHLVHLSLLVFSPSHLPFHQYMFIHIMYKKLL